MRRSELANPNPGWKRAAALLAILTVVALSCAAGDRGTRAAELAQRSTRRIAIQPMTIVGTDGAGYFSDPYPVRLASSLGSRTQVFSGTTKAIMSCAFPVSARCFSWKRSTVDAGALAAKIAARGASITNFQNLDVFQDDAGGWHAALAIGVRSQTHPDHWTVLVHVHPTTDAAPGTAPLAWSADTVLTGSFSNPVDGNYDGKYLEDQAALSPYTSKTSRRSRYYATGS